MILKHHCIIIFLLTIASLLQEGENAVRKKRHLLFPEGSSLSVAICMTVQTDITPGEIFTEGINWGISYDLPNDTKQFKEFLDKPKKMMQRRHRRDLYSKMESILDSMGYRGRNCILRSLCEAYRHLKPKGSSLVDEILRIVFRYPGLEWPSQEQENFEYYEAKRQGRTGRNAAACHHLYPGCPFSLIDMALGRYSSSWWNREPP